MERRERRRRRRGGKHSRHGRKAASKKPTKKKGNRHRHRRTYSPSSVTSTVPAVPLKENALVAALDASAMEFKKATDEEKEKYSMQLASLATLGFNDIDLNVHFLKDVEGSLPQAYECLVAHMTESLL